MVGDFAYMEAMKNCQKWNSRAVVPRLKGNRGVYDNNTNVMQRPTTALYRRKEERCKPSNPTQFCTYPAVRYRRSKQISSEACEHKYFLTSNPALRDTVDQILNPNGIGSNENSEQSTTVLRSSTVNGSAKPAFETFELDQFDYDFEENDNDPSDEDDWGSSRRRGGKRKAASGQTPTARPNNRRSNAGGGEGRGGGGGGSAARPRPVPEDVSNAEVRPFACQHCGARYKSRPGLTYHRLHVHKDEQLMAEMPKMLNNTEGVSNSCDLCLGTRELNKKSNVPEELVSCHDCGRSAHPSCVNFTPNMLVTTKKYGWQCIECKSCTFCGTSEDDAQLLFCDDCDRGFHLYCLKPPLKQAPEGKWSCHLCQSEFGPLASMPAR
ncbi:unnamed protein product [Bursaphelenchus okinawaensis]|uniref:Uncharacterized protein n=1 Tax=Bursaphelenchus okinawaensis TaxID=465554 RepID=A0A811LR31_9BILA|nr:unnamed protein product [Bursaphelenchus okinawaensis]CAG9127043.1 unnamed protein product [Bursaphelenchus okinawaensis]